VLVELDKDGTLVNFEVRGEFFVTVRKKNVETVSLALKGQTRGVDYKAHPNMDRSKWASEMVLALRDPNRPYPLDMTTSVLKWRALPGDAKFLPISGSPPSLNDFSAGVLIICCSYLLALDEHRWKYAGNARI
jgi:hypothetical protein